MTEVSTHVSALGRLTYPHHAKGLLLTGEIASGATGVKPLLYALLMAMQKWTRRSCNGTSRHRLPVSPTGKRPSNMTPREFEAFGILIAMAILGPNFRPVAQARVRYFGRQDYSTVDALLEYCSPSDLNLTVMLEVKHHGRAIDKQTIQAVATRARGLGLSKSIVVSSSDFTSGAIAEAEQHDVTLVVVESNHYRLEVPNVQPFVVANWLALQKSNVAHVHEPVAQGIVALILAIIGLGAPATSYGTGLPPQSSSSVAAQNYAGPSSDRDPPATINPVTGATSRRVSASRTHDQKNVGTTEQSDQRFFGTLETSCQNTGLSPGEGAVACTVAVNIAQCVAVDLGAPPQTCSVEIDPFILPFNIIVGGADEPLSHCEIGMGRDERSVDAAIALNAPVRHDYTKTTASAIAGDADVWTFKGQVSYFAIEGLEKRHVAVGRAEISFGFLLTCIDYRRISPLVDGFITYS